MRGLWHITARRGGVALGRPGRQQMHRWKCKCHVVSRHLPGINKLNVMSCRDICLKSFNIRHRHLPTNVKLLHKAQSGIMSTTNPSPSAQYEAGKRHGGTTKTRLCEEYANVQGVKINAMAACQQKDTRKINCPIPLWLINHRMMTGTFSYCTLGS